MKNKVNLTLNATGHERKNCMRLFTVFVLLIVTSQAFAQFTPNDQRIGDTTVNYVNPEISPIGNYMIWIEIDTANGVSGKVWQCGIDPNTGDLIPTNGKGFNPFYSNVYARPADWGVDSLGLYYVGATFFGQIKFVRPTSPTTATVTNIAMPVINKRRVFYPSQLPGVNKRFVSYILNDSINGFSSTIPQNSYYQLRLLDLDNPANDYLIEQQPSTYPATIPMDVIVPRWIKGSSYLTFGYKGGNGKAQAKEFNAFAPTNPPIPVTNDLANKVDGYPVLNKINGNQYFMAGINASDTAYFYKRTAYGSLFVKNEVVVPQTVNLQNPAFNQSHEPFLFNNQLYSTFQINNDGGNFFETTFNQPGAIWLTTIDSSTQTMWLLSDFDSTLSISEPEPLPGNNKIWVYYSAVKIDTAKPYLKRIFQLRRCETPMNIVTSVEDEREIPAQFTLSQNYPNPFNPSTIIKFEIERKSLVTLKIYDILGKEVAVLINEEKYPGKYRVKFNAGRLAGGIYFYTLKTAGFYQTKKLVLLK
ncbi:MAG: T9SS type A sorting domain-containing protein [Bacteroidetes bacterium]|nr:T9SS type A sorting domain-containing protein [Bacteroidota bacterium]